MPTEQQAPSYKLQQRVVSTKQVVHPSTGTFRYENGKPLSRRDRHRQEVKSRK